MPPNSTSDNNMATTNSKSSTSSMSNMGSSMGTSSSMSDMRGDLCNQLVLSRLPTGHGHTTDDGRFGIIMIDIMDQYYLSRPYSNNNNNNKNNCTA